MDVNGDHLVDLSELDFYGEEHKVRCRMVEGASASQLFTASPKFTPLRTYDD